MGQVSRMAKSDRFLEAFNIDYKTTFKSGDRLVVKRASLGTDDHDKVVEYVVLVDKESVEHALLCSEVFDPEFQDMDDLLELLLAKTKLSEEEILEKFKKNNLGS